MKKYTKPYFDDDDNNDDKKDLDNDYDKDNSDNTVYFYRYISRQHIAHSLTKTV